MSDSNKNCVHELQKERAACSFIQEEITKLLDDGDENTKMRRSLEDYYLNNEKFKDEVAPEYLSHADKYNNELRKACAMVDSLHNDPNVQSLVGQVEGIRMLMSSKLGLGITKDGNPLSLHYIMFLPALVSQGTQEQQSYWISKAWSGEIIGTYAQTELGHGTFLRGLETTATYDPQTEEFVLNSPTITSLKWWPGGLGKTSNHAVVMAQLYTGGQCYGPHAFMVPLRDTETHKSLPGVIVGEIGPRLGMNTNDNGFLRLDQVRVPREHMLMQHAQVTKSGEYIKPASSKLAYGTMVFVRVAICFDVSRQLQRAVTIAVRYAAVRRQGEIVPDAGEVQILDYQSQQNKLLPQIATVFALTFAARRVWATYNDVTHNIDDGNLAKLPELHALSCGLKAASSKDCTEGIEVCRLACGGHGYLASSNLPRILTTSTAAQTYEGENTVMWLQLARYLVKVFKDAQTGAEMAESVAYFADAPQKADDVLSNEGLIMGWQGSTLYLLSRLTQRLHRMEIQGFHPDEARNTSALLSEEVAQVFTSAHICRDFVKSVQQSAPDLSASTRAVLDQLCRLYLIHHTLKWASVFFRSGWLTSTHFSLLEDEHRLLLASLRPQAVPLVDSFDIHDGILGSTLGCWDGRVYERMYEAALKSPLNQTDVPEGYEKYLKPLLKSNL